MSGGVGSTIDPGLTTGVFAGAKAARIPLYDTTRSFWDNLELGPRPLTRLEESRLEALKSEIEALQAKYGVDLSAKVFGKTVASPIGLASGPAANSEWLKFYSRLGYDILTAKTVRDRFWPGYALPNILAVAGDFREGFTVSESFTGTITNSFGIGSPSPEGWMNDYGAMAAGLAHGKAFVMSVTATADHKTAAEEIIEQYASLAERVKAVGADAVELNLSCPNGLTLEGALYADAHLSRKVLDKVLDAVGPGYPVLVKVGHLKDYEPFVSEVAAKIYGVVAVNAMPARVVLKNGTEVFPDRGGRSGVSGLALKPLGLDAVKQLHGLRDRRGLSYKIVGVGGIIDVATALEYLEYSDAIEIAAAAIYDPILPLQIKKALLETRVHQLGL